MLTVVSPAQASCNVGASGGLAPQVAVLRGGCAGLTGRGGHTGSRCLICIGGVSKFSGELFGGSVIVGGKESDLTRYGARPPLDFKNLPTEDLNSGLLSDIEAILPPDARAQSHPSRRVTDPSRTYTKGRQPKK